jgi:outer membrane protein
MIIFSGVLTCSVAIAADQVEGFVAAGVYAGSDYEGSQDFAVRPALSARMTYQHYTLQTEGLGLRLNVTPFRVLQFGPCINYRFGRDDVENEIVSRLRSIDSSIEGGGFISLGVPGPLPGADILSFGVKALTDLTGVYDGTLVTYNLRYSVPISAALRVAASVNATYASDEYMQTYFSIDADNSGRSGLQEFAAEGGMKNIGANVTINYALTEVWGVTSLVGYSRLRGDAASSPIVADEGSVHQFSGLLALSCSF